MSLMTKINETKDFLVTKGIETPEFGLILGSGLGELAEEVVEVTQHIKEDFKGLVKAILAEL